MLCCRASTLALYGVVSTVWCGVPQGGKVGPLLPAVLLLVPRVVLARMVGEGGEREFECVCK